jgi:hypothetical protein
MSLKKKLNKEADLAPLPDLKDYKYKSPFDGKDIERAVHCNFCKAELENKNINQPCPLCKKGKGVFVEVKSNITELPKHKSPLQDNKPMYINQDKPVNQEQGMLVPNTMAQSKNKKIKMPRKYISEEFKEFKMPQKKRRYDVQEIENSADSLAIDG